MYGSIFYIAYAARPEGILHRPLRSLTLNDLAQLIGFLFVAAILIRLLFNPMDDEQVQRVWGWLGVGLVGLFIFAAVYFSYCTGCRL